MIGFSHCKINLGLNVVKRRTDGYHDIRTLFYAVQALSDAVEVKRAEYDSFGASGIVVDCPAEKNLCVKALQAMRRAYPDRIGPTMIRLHKTIPLGAGLGGGSANATEVLKLLNREWEVGLSVGELETLAAQVGSDTAFFVQSGCALAEGRGELLTPYPALDLSGYYILLAKPDACVSTAEAFSGITPAEWNTPLEEVIRRPIEEWKYLLNNDFEPSVFRRIPYLAELKQAMYDAGAMYAAMSGSGSTVFGLFDTPPTLTFDHFYRCVKL